VAVRLVPALFRQSQGISNTISLNAGCAVFTSEDLGLSVSSSFCRYMANSLSVGRPYWLCVKGETNFDDHASERKKVQSYAEEIKS